MRPRTRTRISFKRFLYRTLLGVILIPAVILAVRLAWGREASGRAEAARARLRAQNVPILPADWADPLKISSSDDALIPLRAAIAGMQLTEAERELVRTHDGAEAAFSPAQARSLKFIWSQHQNAIAALDLAAQKPAAGWPLDLDLYYPPPPHPLLHRW